MALTGCSWRLRLSRGVTKLRRAVRRVLKCDCQTRRQLGLSPPTRERRREVRCSLHVPIYLRPAEVRGLTTFADACQPPVLAVTRNISLHGLGWVHDQPLSSPRMLAEFDVGRPEPLWLLVEVAWTVQDDDYAYRSGGRILGICRRV